MSAVGFACMSVRSFSNFAAAHAGADDVEERDHPGLRPIDDALLEVLEVAPARAAGVIDGRHTRRGT